MNVPFPSPLDDDDNVIFTLDSGVKLIGRRCHVEYKFGEECITDERIDQYVPGFCFIVPIRYTTCHLFVVNCKDTLKAYQELKEHQHGIIACIDDSYLSCILINEGLNNHA